MTAQGSGCIGMTGGNDRPAAPDGIPVGDAAKPPPSPPRTRVCPIYVIPCSQTVFGVGILDYEPAPEEELRTILQRWVDSFRDYSFTTGASSKGVAAWPVEYDGAARHSDMLADRLSTILVELQTL